MYILTIMTIRESNYNNGSYAEHLPSAPSYEINNSTAEPLPSALSMK